jgi:hypothetical protein
MEDSRRQELAEIFLQEEVYAAREQQAVRGALVSDDGPGACGLGETAETGLELSPRGRELFDTLFEGGLGADETAQARELIDAWVTKQDALDRKRNHFLKDFRHKHGFDRGAYDADQAAAYRVGLDAVNAEVDLVRGEFARRLVGVGA